MKVTRANEIFKFKESTQHMKKRSLLGLVTLLTLFGCSSSKEVVPDLPPAQLYAQAKTALQEGYLTGAITKLEAMDSRYPFGHILIKCNWTLFTLITVMISYL